MSHPNDPGRNQPQTRILLDLPEPLYAGYWREAVEADCTVAAIVLKRLQAVHYREQASRAELISLQIAERRSAMLRDPQMGDRLDYGALGRVACLTSDAPDYDQQIIAAREARLSAEYTRGKGAEDADPAAPMGVESP